MEPLQEGLQVEVHSCCRLLRETCECPACRRVKPRLSLEPPCDKSLVCRGCVQGLQPTRPGPSLTWQSRPGGRRQGRGSPHPAAMEV